MINHYNFSLIIPNKIGETRIFSLPQTNHYQTINDLIISSKSHQIIKDEKWGNIILIERLNDVKSLSVAFQHSGNKIRPLFNRRLTIDDYKNIFQLYIESDRFISGNDPEIKNLTKHIIGKEKNLLNIVRNLYQYTIDNLKYARPIDGLYSYKQVLKNRVTDCGGFSTLLISLLRSLNIPCRLVVGFMINDNNILRMLSNFRLFTFNFKFLLIHAWLEVLLPDENWFPLDPSIEWRRLHHLTNRLGGFGFIPDDRLVVSFGEDFNLKINNENCQIDILQKPIYI